MGSLGSRCGSWTEPLQAELQVEEILGVWFHHEEVLMVLVHGRALGCERKQLWMILGFQCEPLPGKTDLPLTAVMKLFEGNGSRALGGLE